MKRIQNRIGILRNGRLAGRALLYTLFTLFAGTTLHAEAPIQVLPLPESAFRETHSNPLMDLTDKFVGSTGTLQFHIPNNLLVENVGGSVIYSSENNTLEYAGGENGITLKADTGLDIEASNLTAVLDSTEANLQGPLTLYQADMLTRASHGTFNWETQFLDVYDVRTKVNGLLIRGTHIEYRKDDEGKQFMKIHDAYVSTDDVKEPEIWVGAGELTVYPGDYGRLTRLSVAGKNFDFAVPVLGWITFSHSLNPEEGYLPIPGTKSIWGGYLLNRYGFLIGNRRVENAMPVSDYVLLTHLDWRERRGLATGFDFYNRDMKRHYKMEGLSVYYLADKHPMINPVRRRRSSTPHNRGRITLQAMWDLPVTTDDKGTKWTAQTYFNILSDEYVLRDFYEHLSLTDNKPDNVARIVRKTKDGQLMLWTRVSPNDYYSTDRRVELSYYRARAELWNTGISYETRNSASYLQQSVPATLRTSYKTQLDKLRDQELVEYYTRLLNTAAYTRVNSAHEFTTSLKILKFLNITPKGGVGYSGYYDVSNVGSDNRCLYYLGCNFDVKFYRTYRSIKLPWLYGKGLTHVLHPYATISHCNISSSNPYVPKVDTWSTTLSNSSCNPMALDLMGFSGIDSWGTWTIWRLGASNCFTTKIDGSTHTLLSWNTFIDYNVDNPNTNSIFSDLYTYIRFNPTQHCSLTLEAQTPTIKNGDGFSQYNTSVTFQPCHWFEGTLGHSYISNHQLIRDASQAFFRTVIRIDEKNCIAGRWSWDVEQRRFPIQQYGAFRKIGPWYIGATLFLRNNGGKREKGCGMSFSLGETGTALPVEFF